jgi:hypothetical protein
MKYIVLLIFILASIKIYAQVNDCLPPTSQTDLDINNVRATILNGGDMWHDLNFDRGYEVPKGSGKHSLLAGALWIGGVDQAGQLKLAGQTYRQSGSDFYPGPINQSNVTTTQIVCNEYDRHWNITRHEVLDFINTGIATPAILDWPGNGDQSLNHPQFLAPFFDANADGIYNPADGDYPGYDLTGTACHDVLLGDQTIWWVYNDVGNIHFETGGIPMGVEVQAMAYAYSSFDVAINNATFYSYKIINRSGTHLDSTYIGFWTDLGIGNYLDDNAGCDVVLNLAYGYNQDGDDDGLSGYGLNPPSVGIKILDGPSDDNGSLMGMSKFIVYYNDLTVWGNPDNTIHFYNYLRATWKDGTPLTYGGTGYGGSIPTNYAFPDSSDPAHSTSWVQFASSNLWQRRFVQSSGPFTFQPGEVQYVNTAVVWARADSGGPIASLHKLKTAASTVQNYFDNCFFAVGINEPDLLNGIKLFPNPSLSGKFAISNIPVGSEISIYTMDGKLIEKKELLSNSYESKMKVGKGVYLIRVKNKSAEKVLKWINLY